MNRVIPNKPTWREREVEKEKQRRAEEARRIEEERLASIRKTETNFPTLGGNKVTAKPVTNSGLFAKMAKDWKEKEDTEAAMERQRKEDEERERVRSTFYTYRTSRFSPRGDDGSVEEEEPFYRNRTDNDGWTQVDTKKTRPVRERRESEDEQPAEIQVQNEELGEDYRRDY